MFSLVWHTLGMADRTVPTIRAQARADITAEIKAAARRQLAVDGANLSLRSVAREVGLSPSALYRYFKGRDALLTALIIESYEALGEAAETGDAAVPDRRDLPARWVSMAHAMRDWAVANPKQYTLIHGSPLPGYAAPQTTVEAATRPVRVIGTILAEALESGLLDFPDPAAPKLPKTLHAEMRTASDFMSADSDAPTTARVLTAWTQLFGALNFELFGTTNNLIEHRRAWFDHQTRSMADFIGLRSPAG
jgi:AcrR family transcriptional regulator